jgi:ATP phosphoribosyltransferase regulatory subunit
MSSAWVLPDHLADVLPSEARHIEELRRLFLDTARSYGYELVMPPMLEHLESLLSGTGSRLDLQTFKLVDQLSGRTLGLRADTTPQVARIDAHLLNRSGVCRLCYCGPVLHTLPERPYATREPLQLGAELYGHAGIEADLEILDLALSGLKAVNCPGVLVDFGDARVVGILLSKASCGLEFNQEMTRALSQKDIKGVTRLLKDFSVESSLARAFTDLVHLYGDARVLDQAEKVFAAWPEFNPVLNELRALSAHLKEPVVFDLADARGYGYYSGVRFAIYVQGCGDALVRGGRYDEVGAIFGRARSAVGFSLDLKALVEVVPKHPRKAAIKAPWAEDEALRHAITHLRSQGETVVCVLPGHSSELDEFECDRQLSLIAGTWTVTQL